MNHKSLFPCWQPGLHILFAALLIVGMVLSAKTVSSVAAASPLPDPALAPKRTITVEAFIDGRSWLVFRKNTAQWYHLDFAAPGRWEFRDLPTIINGEEWFPVWPDVPDAENRDCYCYSSTFKGVKPGFHHTHIPVVMNILQARGAVTILEYPSAENDYAFIIEFDDNPYTGADTYLIELVFQPGYKL